MDFCAHPRCSQHLPTARSNVPGRSGAFACDLEIQGLLTGEADGDGTREDTCLKAAVLLRLANIISPPSYLWGGRALAGDDMKAWLVSSSLSAVPHS